MAKRSREDATTAMLVFCGRCEGYRTGQDIRVTSAPRS
jgi:hypothetical protein